MRVSSISLLLVAVGCAPDRSISAWSQSLAADATSVYWIDKYPLGLRAYRRATGRIDDLSLNTYTSFDNLKLSSGSLFWSGTAPGTSLQYRAAIFTMPASGGTPAMVHGLDLAENVLSFDVLDGTLYLYVQRDDPDRMVWTLREVSLSNGSWTDVQLGEFVLTSAQGRIAGSRGQQVLATASGVFYLLWEVASLRPIDRNSLSVFRLSPDGRTERLGNTTPPFVADRRLAVTSDAAYWLGADGQTIQTVPATGGTVHTALSIEGNGASYLFPSDRLCTLAASPAQLFAFRCTTLDGPFDLHFRLLAVDPVRGTSTETLKRRAAGIGSFIAVGALAYWFETVSLSDVPRLHSSE